MDCAAGRFVEYLFPRQGVGIDGGDVVVWHSESGLFGAASYIARLVRAHELRGAHIEGDATGADVLIHEVASGHPEVLAASAALQLVAAHHTTPRECGEVFAKAKPKLAVYSHLILFRNQNFSAPTLDELVAYTRETYDGPLEVGEDLMSFEIGDEVTVRRFQP